jgi:transcriptional regulator of aromatic amino acid metabolism
MYPTYFNVCQQDDVTYVNVTPAFETFAKVQGIEPSRVIACMTSMRHHRNLQELLSPLGEEFHISPGKINLVISPPVDSKVAMLRANEAVKIAMTLIFDLVVLARSLGRLGLCHSMHTIK